MVLRRLWSFLGSFVSNLWQFCMETIEWRRPITSSLYLMLTNAVFWYTVFYLDHDRQEYILLFISTFSICHFLSDRISKLKPVEYVTTTKTKYLNARQKQGFKKHFTLLRFTLVDLILANLVWPLVLLWRWICFSTVELVTFLLCSASFHLLRNKQIERACWVAYGTVVIVLIVPPWRYNEVNKQILNSIGESVEWTRTFFLQHIWIPIVRLLSFIRRTLRYYFFGEWIPPIVHRVRRSYSGLKYAVRSRIIDPLWRGVCRFGAGLRYYFCGHWIPPLLTRLTEAKETVSAWIWKKLIDPCWRLVNRIWEGFLYVALFRWVPPAVDWMRVGFWEPLVWHVTHFRQTARYVFTGQWLPGLKQYLAALPGRFVNFVKNGICLPVLSWMRNFMRRSTLYVRNNLMVPAAEYCRKSLFRAKKAIKNKIIRPAIRNSLAAVAATFELIYALVIRPTFLYLSVWFKRSKRYAAIQWVKPGVAWLKEKLPDKSPFVEDSDTELKDFLPEGEGYKGMSRAHSEGEDSDEAGFIPGPLEGGASRRDSEDESLDEEEKEFVRGLDFPTVRDSESSDDEFSLRKTRNKNHRIKKQLAALEAYRNQPESERKTKKQDESLEEMRTNGERDFFKDNNLTDVHHTVPDIDDEFVILESADAIS